MRYVQEWYIEDVHIRSSPGVTVEVSPDKEWKAMPGAHSGSICACYPQYENPNCYVGSSWHIAMNYVSTNSAKPTGIRLHAWSNEHPETGEEMGEDEPEVHDGYIGYGEDRPKDFSSLDVTDLFEQFWKSPSKQTFQHGPYFKDNGETGPRIHVSRVVHRFQRIWDFPDNLGIKIEEG